MQQDFPARQIRLVTSIERLKENNKVSNLYRLVKEARYELLVMSDSDVRVGSDYLREIAAAAGWMRIAAAYLAAYLILRIGVAWAAGVWGLRDRTIGGKLWLLPLRDAIRAVVWVLGFFSDRIRWRGSEFRVKNGLLTAVAEHSQKN